MFGLKKEDSMNDEDVKDEKSVSIEDIKQEEIAEDLQKNEVPSLGYKEIRALKKARYAENIHKNPKFTDAFVILNKKTGQMVELKASSSAHACNIIGWKPNKVKLIEHKKNV